jgi:adenylate cyclase
MNYRGMVNRNASATEAKNRFGILFSRRTAPCKRETRHSFSNNRNAQSASLARIAPLCSLQRTTGAIALTSHVTDADDFDLRVETTTIMFADVVESMVMIETHESVAVIRIRDLLAKLVTTVIPKYEGELIERRGDGLVVRFADSRSAVRCSLNLHQEARAFKRPGSEISFSLRVGLHRANVYTDGTAVFGHAVNVTARISSLAEPGQTVTSRAVRDDLTNDVDCRVVDLGDFVLKHTSDSFRVFSVSTCDQTQELVAMPPVSSAKPRVAILPFAIHFADSQKTEKTVQTLLGEGVAAHVARTEHLSVVSWFTSRAFADTQYAVGEIAKKIDCAWLLAGSAYLDGQKLFVVIEIVDALRDESVWSSRVDGTIPDLLNAQSEVCSELARIFVHRVIESETRKVSRHALPTIASHSLLIGAIGLMYRSGRQEFLRSRDALEYLLERHPRMHAARPWLAQWYVLKHTRSAASGDRESDASIALAQLNRALDALPEDSFALSVSGFIEYHLRRSPASGSELLTKAIVANPNDVLAHIFRAATFMGEGKVSAAWDEANVALSLSPFDPLIAYMRSIAAGVAFANGKNATAAALAERSINDDPTHPSTWRVLILAKAKSGQVREASSFAQRYLAQHPDFSVASYRRMSPLREAALDEACELLRLSGIPLN